MQTCRECHCKPQATAAVRDYLGSGGLHEPSALLWEAFCQDTLYRTISGAAHCGEQGVRPSGRVHGYPSLPSGSWGCGRVPVLPQLGSEAGEEVDALVPGPTVAVESIPSVGVSDRSWEGTPPACSSVKPSNAEGTHRCKQAIYQLRNPGLLFPPLRSTA